ncbi:MAG: hypothetical protein Q7S16_05455 [bacterium]|nr:hypothetical protein [bacterium]
MGNKRTITSIGIIVVLIGATVGLLWWSNQPTRVLDDVSTFVKPKEKKMATDLFSDPRFQELRQGGGTIEIGTKGNANPFEPFE